MNKIHVISKYFYPPPGGIEVSMLESFSRLVRDGYEITVHTGRDSYMEKNSLPAKAEINGIKIKRYPAAWYGFWPRLDWDEASAVTLHNFNIFPHLAVMLFTLWRKIRSKKNYLLVLHTHGGYLLPAALERVFPGSQGRETRLSRDAGQMAR
ncbi:MAG: hypothetical protein MUC28_03720 [Planctomycetes bacterium]|nr:hypothetical protein [Planctomycetota bacterium]